MPAVLTAFDMLRKKHLPMCLVGENTKRQLSLLLALVGHRKVRLAVVQP